MAFFLNAFYIFKISLTKYFKTKEQIPVFFDRNFKTPHYQMQAVPVPAKKAAQVAALFVVSTRVLKYVKKMFTNPLTRRILVHRIRQKKRDFL